MNFTAREIQDRDSLGFFLRSQRQKQGFSLSDVARKILVAERHLQNLEAGNFNLLPGEIYFKNFLKRYAEFLGYSYEEVYNVYGQTGNWEDQWIKNTNQPRLPLSFTNFITWPKVFKAALVSLVAMLVFGYLGFTAFKFMEPPSLTVFEPQDKIVTQVNHILVSGYTDPNAQVTINQEEVVLDDGYFSKTLDLQSGVNDIIVVATKKHGHFSQITRQVIVAEKANNISKN